MTKNINEYQVLEDNAGGLYLFFFDCGVILGLENIENAEPGDLDGITFEDARRWDGQMENPAEVYSNITSYEYGCEIVADENGVYPQRMGRAAQRVYRIDED